MRVVQLICVSMCLSSAVAQSWLNQRCLLSTTFHVVFPTCTVTFFSPVGRCGGRRRLGPAAHRQQQPLLLHIIFFLSPNCAGPKESDLRKSGTRQKQTERKTDEGKTDIQVGGRREEQQFPGIRLPEIIAEILQLLYSKNRYTNTMMRRSFYSLETHLNIWTATWRPRASDFNYHLWLKFSYKNDYVIY